MNLRLLVRMGGLRNEWVPAGSVRGHARGGATGSWWEYDLVVLHANHDERWALRDWLRWLAAQDDTHPGGHLRLEADVDLGNGAPEVFEGPVYSVKFRWSRPTPDQLHRYSGHAGRAYTRFNVFVVSSSATSFRAANPW